MELTENITKPKINKTVSITLETWDLFMDNKGGNFSRFVEECIWDSLGDGKYRRKKAMAKMTEAKEELEKLGLIVELEVRQI